MTSKRHACTNCGQPFLGHMLVCPQCNELQGFIVTEIPALDANREACNRSESRVTASPLRIVSTRG
jgi:hypothetical protein